MKRKEYKAFRESVEHPGKDTGPETLTEQEYIPIAVQIKRFQAAGEMLKLQKHALFQLGWDEDYNMNKIQPHPIHLDQQDRVELKDRLDEIKSRIGRQRIIPEDDNSPEEDPSPNPQGEEAAVPGNAPEGKPSA